VEVDSVVVEEEEVAAADEVDLQKFESSGKYPSYVSIPPNTNSSAF
jgi:hypothetical protein